ncbi:MAG: DUF1501 domain-containing protein [Planctomycetes bacterium]|nr:DUF1501 domain-containing protein [Planctomycetota bacterium]
MNCQPGCGSEEHLIARRKFLGGLALGAGVMVTGMGNLAPTALARQLGKSQKRMIVIDMHGGLSQLESWDPKPGTDTGGPFRAIPTSVPGTHISELLPQTAKQMHHLSLVRGINTKNDDHGKGTYMTMTGRRQTPATEYPEIGAVVARSLDSDDKALPGHIKIRPSGGGGGRSADSAYLGPRFASIVLGEGKAPENTACPADLTEESSKLREEFRRALNDHFLERRRTAETDAYTQSYEQAQEFVKQRDIFDITKEPEQDQKRYGLHDFGRHCLLARRLLEKGITFVQVRHSNYDTHNENFNFHIEQLGEFDGPFATLVADLAERGMLDSTLIVVLSEFGRTPKINQYYGRDHWGKAWSICLGGAGIVRGGVIGKTNKNGTEVTEREVDAGHLFHTYLRALGLKSTANFLIAGKKMPVADPAFDAIPELLA